MTEIRSFSRRMEWISPNLYLPNGMIWLFGASIDVGVVTAATALSELSYNGGRFFSGHDRDAAIVASLVFLLIGKHRCLYTLKALLFPKRILTTLLIAPLLVAVTLVGLTFVFQDLTIHSLIIELLFSLYAMSLAPLARLAFGRLLRSAHSADLLRGRRAVIIGDGRELSQLTSENWLEFGVSEMTHVALMDDANALCEEDRARVALALRLARTTGAVEFALLIPWRHERRIAETLEALRPSPLGVRLYPDAATRALLFQGKNAEIGSYLALELRRPALVLIDRAAKRAFDIVVATLALLALAPAMLLIAVVVRSTSPGPVIFKQTRRGFDGREFRIWKFRTMIVAEDGLNFRQVARGDPRVTPVGRWLRRMSLDELPQLFNVLKGEMSIIGPRPHALAHDDAYGAAILEYALRRHVKPGLTGAAQVEGLRGETRTLAQMQARLARDLWYIDNWSIWLDLRIACKTLLALLKDEAY